MYVYGQNKFYLVKTCLEIKNDLTKNRRRQDFFKRGTKMQFCEPNL